MNLTDRDLTFLWGLRLTHSQSRSIENRDPPSTVRQSFSAQTLKPSARSCSRPSSVILSGPHGGIQTQLIRWLGT